MKLNLITYGLGNELIPNLIAPIKNRFVKPEGGLWASPVDSEYGWRNWCEDENFGDLSTSFEFQFDGNVFVINSVDDLDRMKWFETYQSFYPDFEALLAEGCDAVFLTTNGQWATRLSSPKNLYGWDCESVLCMNKDRIKYGI